MKPTLILSVAALIFFAVIAALGQRRHVGLPFLRVNDKYGFIDRNCQMVISAQYSEAFDFSEGLAAVKIGEQWGYIDESGAVVIPPRFAGAWHFSDGLASAKLDEQSPLWGFVDRTGKLVIRPQFGMPLWFSEGLVEGYGENQILYVPLGYVDKSGKYVLQLDEPGLELEFLVKFSEGLARVSMQPKHADGSVGPSKYGYAIMTGGGVTAANPS